MSDQTPKDSDETKRATGEGSHPSAGSEIIPSAPRGTKVQRWWGLLPDLRIEGIVAANEHEAKALIIEEIIRQLKSGESGLLVELGDL